MLAVHVGPTDLDGPAGRLYALPHGRAAILFGLVAGVGVSLLARSRSTSPAAARLKLLWRSLLLLPLGLALQRLDHGVYVILQDYALLFLLAIVVLGLSDRVLLTLAGLTAVLGPLGYLWGRMHAPEAFDRDVIEFGQPAGDILHGLVLSGPYPLITWAAPFLVGLWLGRRDLRTVRARRWLLAAGGAVTVAAFGASVVLTGLLGEPSDVPGWDHLVADTAHSQMPLWVIGATGSAAFLLGGALAIERLAGRLVWPLVAAGQLALTVYVGHLLALHTAREALTSDTVSGALVVVAGFTLTAAVLATAWRALFARGPLERLLQPPWSWRSSTPPPRSRPPESPPGGVRASS